MRNNTRRIGGLGEQIACNYLVGKDFTVIERNYLRKWGEIDIVARKSDTVHFVEVKAVSYETTAAMQRAAAGWRPEELVHQRKLHQIEKALTTWISENQYEGKWQIDVIAVKMVPSSRYASVKYIDNVIIG